MELQDLVGEHTLTGVAIDVAYGEFNGTAGRYEENHTVRFALDGVVYRAIEDPMYSHKSSLLEFTVTDARVRNVFPPVKVSAWMEPAKYDERDRSVLTLTDRVTGLDVLSVGTGNFEDYYPYFVATWHPENLCLNWPEVPRLWERPSAIAPPKAIGRLPKPDINPWLR